jgi:hypothetical protein
MKTTRSYRALPELHATEHRLSAVIDGVEYAVAYVLPLATYADLDQDFATKMVESYLWTNLMRTIEHNPRKNLNHA